MVWCIHLNCIRKHFFHEPYPYKTSKWLQYCSFKTLFHICYLTLTRKKDIYPFFQSEKSLLQKTKHKKKYKLKPNKKQISAEVTQYELRLHNKCSFAMRKHPSADIISFTLTVQKLGFCLFHI